MFWRKNRDNLARTSYKLERRFVGVDVTNFSGFREMLTISHTLVDSKTKRLTNKNTKMDFSRGKIIDVDIEEIKAQENKEAFEEKSGYLRGYFLELESKDKEVSKKTAPQKGISGFLSTIFRKGNIRELTYREKFEKIVEKASKFRAKLEKGDNIEFKLTPDTTIIIDAYKPDFKHTEIKVLEKRAGKVSKIDYKLEKDYVGMTSGFSDTCYSKALLTVNHTLLNTRDKSVSLKETRVDCLGGHVQEVSSKEIKRSEKADEYIRMADYIRGYQFELTSEDEVKKKKNIFKKLFSAEDRGMIKKHIKRYDRIKEIVRKQSIIGGGLIELSHGEKALVDKRSSDDMFFQVIEKDKRGFKKTEYEVHRHFLGGGAPGDGEGFIQVLNVNTTLLDTRNQVITFTDDSIDMDHSLLMETDREILKKAQNEEAYEHYERNIIEEGKVLEDNSKEQTKPGFLSFLNSFKKGRLG